MAGRADTAGDAERASRGPRAVFLALLAFALPAAALCVHADWHLPFLTDDALISLRYAERLLAGDGLTWTDGEAVEGYSNLLWLLACAALGALGFDLVDAARVLGFAGMLFTLLALCFAYRPAVTGSTLPALLGGSLLAVCAPVAVWTIGGLETPLVVALLAWSIALAWPLCAGERGGPGRVASIGLLLALLCLTRPDAPVFVAAFAVALWWIGGRGGRALATAASVSALPLLAVAGQLAFRLAYYGDWLPNTAYVKAGFEPRRLAEGMAYVIGGLAWLWPVALLAAAGVWAGFARGHRRGLAVLLVACIAFWSLYVAAIGGDILPVYRHLVPVLVCMAFLAALALEWVLRAGAPERRGVLSGVVFALVGACLLWQVAQPGLYERARRETWEWSCRDLAEVLRDGFAPARPLLAVTAAGCLPYFSGLPSLDMLGLNDRHIARHRPPDYVPGVLGHDLGDARYVLDREPDLIVFNLGDREPRYAFGKRMLASPRFLDDYRLSAFEAGDLRAWIWVRRRGRVGMARSADRLEIPGYLLFGAGVVTQQRADGRLAARLDPDVGFQTGAFDLPPGSWRVTTDPPIKGAELMILEARGRKRLGARDADGHFRVRVADGVRVWLALRLHHPALVQKIVIERDPETWKRTPIERDPET